MVPVVVASITWSKHDLYVMVVFFVMGNACVSKGAGFPNMKPRSFEAVRQDAASRSWFRGAMRVIFTGSGRRLIPVYGHG